MWNDFPALTARQRTESVRYELLDHSDRVVQELSGVTSCKIDQNRHSTIRGGGNLTMLRESLDFDPLRHRVKPYVKVTGDGESYEWPLGVFLLDSPTESHSDLAPPAEFTLYDKLFLLDSMKTHNGYTVPAGTVVTARVAERLDYNNLGRHAIVQSPAKLGTAMGWPPGTSLLTIINDLLQAANYFSLYPDGDGVLRGTPYSSPAKRAAAFEFTDDETSVYSPDWTHEEDTFHIPNKVVMSTNGGADVDPMVVHYGLSPTSRYSVAQRGIAITHVEDNVEATSRTALRAMARRKLLEFQEPISKVSLSHAGLPLALNDAVRFKSTRADRDVLTVVDTTSWQLGEGAFMETQLREVVGDESIAVLEYEQS